MGLRADPTPHPQMRSSSTICFIEGIVSQKRSICDTITIWTRSSGRPAGTRPPARATGLDAEAVLDSYITANGVLDAGTVTPRGQLIAVALGGIPWRNMNIQTVKVKGMMKMLWGPIVAVLLQRNSTNVPYPLRALSESPQMILTQSQMPLDLRMHQGRVGGRCGGSSRTREIKYTRIC